MKKSFLIPLSIFFLSTHLAHADICDDFKASVSIQALTTQVSVQAGEAIKIPVKITIGENEAKRWKYIDLSAGIHNDIEGSNSPFEASSIKFGGDLEIPTEFSFQTTRAMGGEYKLGIMLYAQDKSYPGACVFNTDPLQNLKVEIKNKPENTDIDPPVLKTAKFKQKTYQAGDTLELFFQAEDKSDICTVWKEQNGVCNSGTHVELKSLENNDTISFHTPTPIFMTQDKGTYLATIPLSEEYATKVVSPASTS